MRKVETNVAPSGSSEILEDNLTKQDFEPLNTDNLQALTSASVEPGLYVIEEANRAKGRRTAYKLRGASALAASTLLATSLLLSACSDEDDCIPSTPPAGAGTSSYFETPGAGGVDSSNFTGQAQPTPPSSSQFTSATPSTSTTQTYCRSRRTGGFYWYTGSTYVGSSSS